MKKAFSVYIILFLLTGFIYPLVVTGIVGLFFPKQAAGSFIFSNKWVGSRLIGQKFSKEAYFWPRPSAIDYNPLPSGGSNLGPTSMDLKKQVEERKKQFSALPPSDLLYASASGIDPHISPKAAFFQADRVSKARNLDIKTVETLIEKSIVHRRFGFLGEPTVNVLELNLLLDEVNDFGT